VVRIWTVHEQKTVLSCLAQNMGMQIFRSLLSGSRESDSRVFKGLTNKNLLSALVAQCLIFNEKVILNPS